MFESLGNLLGMQTHQPQQEAVEELTPMKQRLIMVAKEYGEKLPIPLMFQSMLGKVWQTLESPQLDDETIMKFIQSARDMLDYIETGGGGDPIGEPDKG